MVRVQIVEKANKQTRRVKLPQGSTAATSDVSHRNSQKKLEELQHWVKEIKK